MTALPGCGLLPVGICEGLLPPPEPAEPEPAPLELDDDGEEPLSSLSCWLKGSLLAKRLNEASWPSWTVGVAETATGEPVVGLVGGCSAPRRVGAAREGVPVAVVVVTLSFACGFGGVFIIFMTRGTWNARTP